MDSRPAYAHFSQQASIRTEAIDTMGKLTDKLEQVGQSSGSGFGFFGRSRAAEQKSRPAAVLVSLRASDTAAAEAAAKRGADALIVSDWKPDADVSAFVSALNGSNTLWGVDVAGESGSYGMLKRAQEAGASFAILDASASAHLLFEQLDHFDLVIALELPKDDMGLMMLRSQNLLPVQVGLTPLGLSKDQISSMSVAEYLRLKLAVESLRFPLLATLRDVPDEKTLPILVRVGFAGLILPGEGAAAETLGQQVQTLREELENTSVRREESSSSALLGGLVSTQGSSLQPERREPEREPDQE
jgi:hypothetical protein